MSGGARKASCLRVRGRLIELEDGGLAPLAEARDRGHLEACDACARALARHVGFLARLRALETVEAAEVRALTAAVEARLPARLRPSMGRGARTRASLALAAAAALVLGALWTTRGLPRAPRPADLGSFPSIVASAPDWAGWLRGLGSLLHPFS